MGTQPYVYMQTFEIRETVRIRGVFLCIPMLEFELFENKAKKKALARTSTFFEIFNIK